MRRAWQLPGPGEMVLEFRYGFYMVSRIISGHLILGLCGLYLVLIDNSWFVWLQNIVILSRWFDRDDQWIILGYSWICPLVMTNSLRLKLAIASELSQ